MKNTQKLNATTQKSYYGKANYYLENGCKILVSYNTPVALIDYNGNFKRLWSGYSHTTQKHINDFRIQNGFNTLSKKEWLALPCSDKTTFSIYISTGFYTHQGTAQLTEAEAEAEVERLQALHGSRCYVWYE